MSHVLLADSIQKAYNNRTVLGDVFLRCETGNIIALFGRNGSGKSTLLKIIFGVVRGGYSHVDIDGRVIVKQNALHKRISYLHQDNFIPPGLSVRATVAMSIPKHKITAFYSDAAIEAIADRKIWQLSGGELRYLELKIVLANESWFVLLDEPFNGLSPLMKESVCRLIVEASAHKGIIITDHDYESVLSIATSGLLMKGGAVKPVGSVAELVLQGYLNDDSVIDKSNTFQ